MMSKNSISSDSGNVQALRDMWSLKAKEQEKPLAPSSNPSRARPEKNQKSAKNTIPILKITNEAITSAPTKTRLPVISINTKPTVSESVEKLPSINEDISLQMPLPPPPPSIVFKHQAQSVATLQLSLNKMVNNEKKDIVFKNRRNHGMHLWHIARHVFRSGLVFNRPRRASDTIIPLLIKTQAAKVRFRTDSIDSTLSDKPFEYLIDYLNSDKEDDQDYSSVSIKTKRSASDTSDCMRRNRLNDSIYQYEMILRHLKNYDQFKLTYPIPLSSSISTKERGKSVDSDTLYALDQVQAKFLARSSIPNRQTQSLSRNAGRSFSEFIMNDLFLSASSRRSSNEQRCLNISHTSSQTDLSEQINVSEGQTANNSANFIHPGSINRSYSTPNEETKAILHDFDAMLENNDQQVPTAPIYDIQPAITPNSEINVIVVNSSVSPGEITTKEKPLMQRLFEGKKTAFNLNDLNMQPIRLPEEMMLTYESAKKKCFFDTEQLLYTAKMVKISRRGYSQHLRMICITTQRLYNITKKDPYPKEGLLFKDILGVTCTPYKDGFVCIHTRDSHDDRGDWLVLVDHPCEFITQLFMAIKRDHNNDNFLKIETQFTHCRRFFGEASSSDCTIEARIADNFRIKKADFDAIIIYTP